MRVMVGVIKCADMKEFLQRTGEGAKDLAQKSGQGVKDLARRTGEAGAGVLQRVADADVGTMTGVGAGAGAVVGGLASLFRKRPSLKKALRDALLGAAGGAAIGGGGTAIIQKMQKSPQPGEIAAPADTAKPAIEEAAAPADTAKPAIGEDKRKMRKGTAVLSSLAAPGLGPAIHGGVVGGADQALISGGSSALGATLGSVLTRNRDLRLQALAATLGNVGGSLGAASYHNRS